MPDSAEQEIRILFERWFEEAAARDLDAVMTHIASDVVSYEHDTPLQYVGASNVREVCRRGFDLTPGEFTWDIPDLHVLVRDDLAVTWGLNHMHAQAPGEAEFDSYSRGTRIFQKIDGAWKMIHQHVSYPYDADTGEAKTELRP